MTGLRFAKRKNVIEKKWYLGSSMANLLNKNLKYQVRSIAGQRQQQKPAT